MRIVRRKTLADIKAVLGAAKPTRMTPREAIALLTKPKSKYGAKSVFVDGIKFDSRREARRWQDLKLLERAGKIHDLQRQVVFELAPSVRIAGEKRARTALRYTADAVYWSIEGGRVVEDSKGITDTSFRIRQHLMKSVHGIDVVLT